MGKKKTSKNSINFFLEEALFNRTLSGRIHALSCILSDSSPDAIWLAETLIRLRLILKEPKISKRKTG